jgi:hypothetical protein
VSLLVRTLLVTVLVPGAAGFGLAIASRRWPADSRLHRGILATIVVVAVFVASWEVMGAPTLTPLDISNWIPHLAVLGFVAAIALLWADKPGLRIAIIAVAAFVIAYVVLRPLVGVRFGGARAAAAMAVAAGSLAVYAGALDFGLRRMAPRVGATVAVISVSAVAAAVAASGTVSVGQVGGAAAAGVGGMWLVVMIRPSPIAAAAMPIAAVGWGVLAIGQLYATLSLALALAILAAPVAGFAVAMIAAKWPARRAALATVAATAAVAAVAVALAVTAGLPAAEAAPGDKTDDNYGYD